MVCPGVQVICSPAGKGVNGPFVLMNEYPTTVDVATEMSFDVQPICPGVGLPLTHPETRPSAVTASSPMQAPLPFAGLGSKSNAGAAPGANPGFGATVVLSLHAAYNPRMPTAANLRR